MEQLILLPTIGINIAVLSMTGVNLGARQIDRVREVYRSGVVAALTLMVAGGVLLVIFAEPLMSLFSDDAEVRSIGLTYLYYEAGILPAYALTFLSAASLQGLKRPDIALYFNIVRQVVAQLLLFWFVVEILDTDITGIWMSVLLINWVLAIGIVIAVRRQLAHLDQPPGSGQVPLPLNSPLDTADA